MTAYLNELLGPTIGPIAAIAVAVLVTLLVLWLVWLAIRRYRTGLFLAGGRGRQPRLAVIDATPVDSHRRLILVRRDDVEHLLMIGGPSDIVVEAGIGRSPSTQKPLSGQGPSQTSSLPEVSVQAPALSTSSTTATAAVTPAARSAEDIAREAVAAADRLRAARAAQEAPRPAPVSAPTLATPVVSQVPVVPQVSVTPSIPAAAATPTPASAISVQVAAPDSAPRVAIAPQITVAPVQAPSAEAKVTANLDDLLKDLKMDGR
jgi:hypothetical protein